MAKTSSETLPSEGQTPCGRIPKVFFELEQLVLLLAGKVLHLLPQQEIVLHAIQINTRADIVLELTLEVAGDVRFEQAEAVIGGGDRRRLLEHQLPAVIEALQGTRDREGYDVAREEFGSD